MNILDYFHGSNAGYVWELYEKYLQDPQLVDERTRAYFAQNPPPLLDDPAPVLAATNGHVHVAAHLPEALAADSTAVTHAVGVANLAQAIREYGHLDAHSNPLYPPPSDPSLDVAFYNLAEVDLASVPASVVGGPIASQTRNAQDGIAQLREVYCGSIGYEYDHVRIPKEREWLRQAAESRQFRQAFDPDGDNAIRLLKRLTRVETFEQFLHKTFLGKKRFSIEGLDVLVPVLDEMVMQSAPYKVKSILIGMAHRGRLNVMAHVLNKPYSDILREFKDPLSDTNADAQGYLGQTGDVKYHKGAFRITPESYGTSMAVKIAPNPSHLELVNPVVEGMARAIGTDVDASGIPRFDHQRSMPVQIHGDASFAGQGTVSETLNFSDLVGYTTGGTIHIIANNQVGFTTLPKDTRGSLYASDLAKGFKIPIVHVNANDPVACLEVARLAVHYRNTFHKDFMIDLVGYRRFGHNEGDEPRFTQPQMYTIVDEMPTVRELWARELVARGFVTAEEADEMIRRHWGRMQEVYDNLDLETPNQHEEAQEHAAHQPEPGIAARTHTAVPAPDLRAIHQALMQFPEGFQINKRLQRVVKRRAEALNDEREPTIDWGTAEMLAFGAILAEGTAIRLTGEDVKRGTFSHRHAVFFERDSGEEYVPLQNFPQSRAAFEVHNSPLTENATIGFEYGYNIERPDRLVLWEGQFGDFVNGAQMMLDEYVSSGRAKWNQTPSLVLLLPHGYEGQGPDHSSARLERFLQMTAEKNMRVVNPTTAAQYFHVLRRQALLLEKDPLPLIVMSPKSLLRHPMAGSSLRELVDAHWYPVIDDPLIDEKGSHNEVKRLVLCSGKVYVDLMNSDLRGENLWVSIARVEQLYPFPKQELQNLFAKYRHLDEVIWLQEEPRNMGAYRFMQPRIGDILPYYPDGKHEHIAFKYIGRQRYASPAEGSATWHKINQTRIVRDAFRADYEDEELQMKRLTS